jgi:hypothetical protein
MLGKQNAFDFVNASKLGQQISYRDPGLSTPRQDGKRCAPPLRQSEIIDAGIALPVHKGRKCNP